MKHFGPKGLVFFTNYNSAKAKDIELNNKMATLFYWPNCHRSVRIQGIFIFYFCYFFSLFIYFLIEQLKNFNNLSTFKLIGLAFKIPTQLSEEYFFSRSKECQWGALLSKQSQPTSLSERSKLLDTIQVNSEKGIEPVYDHSWGGYIIIPYKFEFWQGKQNRLHDRIVFYLKDSFKEVESIIKEEPKTLDCFPDFSTFKWKMEMLDS